MKRLIVAVGFALLLAACSSRSGDPTPGAPANFGPYDGPQGYHGGVFAG